MCLRVLSPKGSQGCSAGIFPTNTPKQWLNRIDPYFSIWSFIDGLVSSVLISWQWYLGRDFHPFLLVADGHQRRDLQRCTAFLVQKWFICVSGALHSLAAKTNSLWDGSHSQNSHCPEAFASSCCHGISICLEQEVDVSFYLFLQ